MLPYGLQLVLLGEFFRLCPKPAAQVIDLLSRWFWVTSFTGWFGGVNTAQATRALSEVRNLARGTGTGFSVVDFDAPAQPFPERFDGRSARVRAFMLYLASLRPRSLRGADSLDLGQLLATRGTRAVGYVFSNPGPLEELFSSPANRMFIDGNQFGQTFTDLTDLSDAELMEVLPTHGFPANSVRRLRSGDRVGLIKDRLDTLVAGEREFMSGLNVTLPSVRTAVSIADSEASDDE